MPQDPIWKIMEHEGRRQTWLARRISYSVEHVTRVKSGDLPASWVFRSRCAEVLGRPESELFLSESRSPTPLTVPVETAS